MLATLDQLIERTSCPYSVKINYKKKVFLVTNYEEGVIYPCNTALDVKKLYCRLRDDWLAQHKG